MATLHSREGRLPVAYVKGAPERILAMCAQVATPDGERPVEAEHWHRQIEALAAGGQRVIALARRTVPDGSGSISAADVESGLTLLGLVGLIDPPRPEAIAAVAGCQ